MSKKNKKPVSDGPKPLISRRMRRRLIRLFLLAVIGSSAYAFYDPSIIPDPAIQNQVITARTKSAQVLAETTQVLPDSLPEQLNLSKLSQYIPQGAVLGNQQIDVENLMSTITTQLKEVPEEKAKQFKQDFCADLVRAATESSSKSTP